eukprot:8259057-Heterocapsa_arctica.AAC.1
MSSAWEEKGYARSAVCWEALCSQFCLACLGLRPVARCCCSPWSAAHLMPFQRPPPSAVPASADACVEGAPS